MEGQIDPNNLMTVRMEYLPGEVSRDRPNGTQLANDRRTANRRVRTQVGCQEAIRESGNLIPRGWPALKQTNAAIKSDTKGDASTRKRNNGTNIPQYEIEALARCLLPEIQKYFESEESKKEFEEWKQQQAEKKR